MLPASSPVKRMPGKLCHDLIDQGVYAGTMMFHLSAVSFKQVQDEEGWISFFPGPFANLTFGIDHRLVAPIIGDMWYTWHSDDAHFRYVRRQSVQMW